MLDRLVAYAQKHGLVAEPGIKGKFIRWAVVCAEDGRFLDVIELGDATSKRNRGRLFERCPDLTQPELVAGGIVRSHFLVGTAEVVALLGKESDTPKVQAKHAYFIRLLRQAATAYPELGHLALLLENPETLQAIRERLETMKARPEDNVTFRVGDVFVVDSPVWHDWWQQYRRQLRVEADSEGSEGASTTGSGTPLMRCFLSGELIAPLRTHPKIEGLGAYGGMPAGDALISFDKEAFCSYGLEQSANAAMSEQTVAAYRSALNQLIREQGHSLGGVRLVYWFKEKVQEEDDLLAWLTEDKELEERSALTRARELADSIRTGKRADLHGNRFYALLLSGVSGRIMVRDWTEGPLAHLAENVHAWLNNLQMVDLVTGTVRPAPGMERIVTSLLPPRRRDQQYEDWVRPLGPSRVALWRAAISGGPIPHSVLSRIVPLNARFHATDGLAQDPKSAVSLLRTRMAVVRLYWNRKERRASGHMNYSVGPYLDEDHPSPAYQCGRLMAVLAEIQRTALGDVGAGVVQRYYAAASATPALVLGRLIRLAQFHLDKIDYRKRRDELEGLLAGIWARIRANIPTTLTLEEQSLFAMGYYQQRAARSRQTSGKTETAKEEESTR